MNVASLELCKELYELSGWESDKSWDHEGLGRETEYHVVDTDRYGKFLAPAYDLGYLLRKLPTNVPNEDNGGSYWLDLCFGDSQMWHASYDNAFGDFVYDSHAHTPEDAACKLAIELFKQGVLK